MGYAPQHRTKSNSDSFTKIMPEDLETAQKQPIKIFFSYAHKDEPLRDELSKHLAILKRQGVISEWHDRLISPGEKWADVIDDRINQAQIILLLVSSDFLASDYCYEIEMRRALERDESGEAVVIPIILRPCSWKGGLFEKLQALPKDAKPVTSWANPDEAFTNIAEGIRATVKLLRSRKRHSATQPALGDDVFLLCDRDDQEDAFDGFIRRDARVLICGIQAAASDLPGSLANRLTKITLGSYASRKWGEKQGAVTDKLITWPEAREAASAQRFLLSRIYRELECDERKPSAKAFVQAFSTRLDKVIVLRHEIRAERCKPEDWVLLKWYLRFWDKVQARGPAPQFVIFLNLIYPEKPSGILRLPWARFDRDAFSRKLQSLFDKSKTPNLLLEELPRVEEHHVKDWFARYGIFDEGERLNRLAELFKERRPLPMKEVEQALKKLLNQIP